MPSLGTTGKLIAAFVMLLLGVVFVGVIASEGLSRTGVSSDSDTFTTEMDVSVAGTHVNDTYNYTVTEDPVSTAWKFEDCAISNIAVTNSSGTVYALTTDYTVNEEYGTITLVNSTATVAGNNAGSNQTIITYDYCADDYMNLTWGRTSINLVGGFFAIAILLISVGLFFSVAKDYGII